MSLAKRSQKVGMPPGTLVHVGTQRFHTPKITIFDYNKHAFQEKVVSSVEECVKFKKTSTVTWINVDGVHDKTLIETFGKHFGFHPLLLEDVMNTDQRLKMDDYGNHLFIVLKMIYVHHSTHQLVEEQVSIIIGPNYIFTFQEKSDDADVFDLIRNRIRQGKASVRENGPDFLAYSLIDAIVDHYFIVLEKISERIETIEETLLVNPTADTLRSIHELKRQTIKIRKSLWPLREVILGLERLGSGLIKKQTMPYLRDVYDHTIQLIDTIETQRDVMGGMIDVYLSSTSNKLNEVMKFLTVIGTIFIPITWITGIYGMNFRHFPELEWKYSYFVVVGIMITIAFCMMLYFKKKKWL
ncbi:MAG: magnesium/cobalt transporter CorA [Candidatus Woesearchaeota archaeon]|nr:magnesium/cobalt transporter CorA [Candidatus Woesearchaeota archaeon]